LQLKIKREQSNANNKKEFNVTLNINICFNRALAHS